MATKTNATAKKGTTKTAPTKSNALNKVNLNKVTHQVKVPENKPLTKYIYPADVKTPSEKKEFRRKARAGQRTFEKAIKRLKKSNDQADKKLLEKTEKDFNKWRKEILTIN